MKQKIIAWAVDAVYRAIKTFAQTAVGALAGATLFSEVDWVMILSASGIAAVASLLMSVSTLPKPELIEADKEGA